MGNKTISFGNNVVERKSYEFTYADISLKAEKDSNNEWRFAKKIDVDAVKGAVKNIFTWIPGERILLPEFGNTIRQLLYEGITDLNSERIISECQMLMTKWEPRAVIDKLFKKDSIEDQENNQVSIIMIWHVVGLPEEKYQQEITV